MHCLNIGEIEIAGNRIIKIADNRAFAEEISSLGSANNKKVAKIKQNSKLYSLYPFVDEDQVLCVDGRFKNSSLNNNCTHPILLPKNIAVTELLKGWCHEKAAHGGRGIILSEIRSNGCWIINTNSKTRQIIFKCVRCRSLCGRLGEQKMAKLPYERTSEAPPFTYCDMICLDHSISRRYGTMFVCLASRTVHTEVTHQIDTDFLSRHLKE